MMGCANRLAPNPDPIWQTKIRYFTCACPFPDPDLVASKSCT